MNNKQSETQSVSVEEERQTFVIMFGALLHYDRELLDAMWDWHTHSLATEDVIKEILATAYYDDWACHVIDVAKVETIATERGITLSDSNLE